jgi:hypothetical protein
MRFLIALIFIAAAALPAQTPAPQYVLAGGLGFNHADTPQIAGELSFGARITDGIYSFSTLKMTGKLSTISTGVSRRCHVSDGFTLSALLDGGLAAGGGTVGGAVSGGGMLTMDVSRWSKIPGSFAYGAIRILESPVAGGVQPAFSFGFGKVF